LFKKDGIFFGIFSILAFWASKKLKKLYHRCIYLIFNEEEVPAQGEPRPEQRPENRKRR
jgi:hypothetical protein